MDTCLTLRMLGNFSCFLSSVDVFENHLFFEKLFQVYHQSVKEFGSRSLFENLKGYHQTTKVTASNVKPHSHCAGVATVHPDAGQPVYRDAPGHIS